MNLFGNSLKFTTDGYVHVTLRLAPPKVDDPPNYVRVELAIEDTGKVSRLGAHSYGPLLTPSLGHQSELPQESALPPVLSGEPSPNRYRAGASHRQQHRFLGECWRESGCVERGRRGHRDTGLLPS
jgi:hypothetical protein